MKKTIVIVVCIAVIVGVLYFAFYKKKAAADAPIIIDESNGLKVELEDGTFDYVNTSPVGVTTGRNKN